MTSYENYLKKIVKYLQKLGKGNIDSDRDAYFFDKMTQLMDDEKFIPSQRDGINFYKSLMNDVQEHHFFVEDDLFYLFQKTKTEIHDRPTPFPHLFFNKTFKVDNIFILGFFIYTFKNINNHKTKRNIYVPCFRPNVIQSVNTINSLDKRNDFDFFFIDLGLEDGIVIKIYDITGGTRKELIKPIKNISTQVNNLANNFLDYINHEKPKIRIVKTPDEIYNKKRIKGTDTIPQIKKYITITDEIKIYLRKLKESKNFSYSHKFWVRGHWRHFNHQKYIGMRGVKKWILPYIKGKGLLVEKKYNVKQVGDSN